MNTIPEIVKKLINIPWWYPKFLKKRVAEECLHDFCVIFYSQEYRKQQHEENMNLFGFHEKNRGK